MGANMKPFLNLVLKAVDEKINSQKNTYRICTLTSMNPIVFKSIDERESITLDSEHYIIPDSIFSEESDLFKKHLFIKIENKFIYLYRVRE